MNHLLILSNINRKYNPTSNCFRIGDFNYINNLLDQFFEHKFDINEVVDGKLTRVGGGTTDADGNIIKWI